MKMRLCLCLLTGLLASLMSASARADEGAKALFNGKDLTGWSGDTELWRVENGEIVGSTHNKKLEHNSFLSYDQEFTDFELRVKVKLTNHNSGIQFRSERQDDHVMAGYQADVAEKTYFGMLYEEKKRGILPYWNALPEEERVAINGAAKLADWNEYVITCEGHHVKMVLNGKTTLDFDDPDGALKGFVGLQLHAGPPMEVRFKDIEIKELKKAAAAQKTSIDELYLKDRTALLMPLADAARSLRLGKEGSEIRVPEGFSVEQVATHELTDTLINMTFDHLGRPVVSAEGDGRGIFILLDSNSDGKFDVMQSYAKQVQNAQGMHFLAPGDLLVNAQGEQGPGLYRLQDTNLDDAVDVATMIIPSAGGIGEHGPHAILTGPDGYLYIMYGNHSHPKYPIEASSPLRGYQEDFLLSSYVDPRGHAVDIRAPGGTIVRLSPDFQHLSEVVGGFRNAYDFDMNAMGEMFTFDSDMEWDWGLPWYRPVRVVHAVPGGDYGWRTGSYNMPDYFMDTLPPTDDVGRGSPVGVCIYQHNVYPEKYRNAVFMGDWSRGRIRVLLPFVCGATYAGETVDFVVGEPLNVTDLEVAPDGLLYFTVGGRKTHGGMYRVRYEGKTAVPANPLDQILSQPQPRSAWGQQAIAGAIKELGEHWHEGLKEAVQDPARPRAQRIQGLEVLQKIGPAPDFAFLGELAADKEAEVRAAAVFLLGTLPLEQTAPVLRAALTDGSPLVQRRACEALARAGVDVGSTLPDMEGLAAQLVQLLGHNDRFVRYAAGVLLQRMKRELWAPSVVALDPATHAVAALEGAVLLARTAVAPEDSDAVFGKLQQCSAVEMNDDVFVMYLRAIQLAFIRDKAPEADRGALGAALGPRFLAAFPAKDGRVNRELQTALAHFQTDGAIPKLLAYLDSGVSREEQIHTVYCLRTIQEGWTPEARAQMVAWFDRGREMGGGASLEGYINNMWTTTLALLPEDERAAAEQRKADALKKRQEEALALLQGGDVAQGVNSELAQMSFDELSEFLEYDPMAYREPNLEHGQQVFVRAKCASCHVFGSIGKGGGPDLSTVTSRFRRRDILEAIMYPSKVVSDQYVGVELELNDLSTVTGMTVGENDQTLTIISVDGQRMEIPKAQIDARKPATGSIMPEGLLYALSMGELVDLINFLENGGGV